MRLVLGNGILAALRDVGLLAALLLLHACERSDIQAEVLGKLLLQSIRRLVSANHTSRNMSSSNGQERTCSAQNQPRLGKTLTALLHANFSPVRPDSA